MNFTHLVQAIADIHKQTRVGASKAVNMALTVRNWLIGAYIVEFEQNGEDRAAYGEELLKRLADRLCQIPRCEERELRRYRQFYFAYPQIREAVTPELLPAEGVPGKWEALSPELPNRSAKPATEDQIFSGKFLLTRLSFSHLELLSALDVPLKRSFYEVECIKGNWSVRELKRQALAGMDNRLFVSKYQLALPQTEVLQRYLDEQRQVLEGGAP